MAVLECFLLWLWLRLVKTPDDGDIWWPTEKIVVVVAFVVVRAVVAAEVATRRTHFPSWYCRTRRTRLAIVVVVDRLVSRDEWVLLLGS